MSKLYPAKILLFGEHTVLRGGAGLAVPYPRYGLRWEWGNVDERLLSFTDYLRTCVPAPFLNVDRLTYDLRQGQRLTGNIPTGYGLGSSGAVCAAILDRYGSTTTKSLPTSDLRDLLATMEGHFHGRSSGTDPLISYLQRPVKMEGADAGAIELRSDWANGFFLVDTGIERNAATLIQQFLDVYRRRGPEIEREWTANANAAIQALQSNDRTGLREAFRRISEYQLREFSHFIPPAFHERWDGGGAYRLKLCGAGGGGMLLGLAEDKEVTEAAFGDRLSWLVV